MKDNIVKKNILVLFVIGFSFTTLLTATLFAASSETLPTFHWSYEFIQALQVRGQCLDLYSMNQPYTRGEVAKSLLGAEKEIRRQNNTVIYKLYVSLLREFAPEIDEVRNPDEQKESIYFRSYLQANLDRTEEEDTKYNGLYRGGVGAQIGSRFFVFSGVNFNQYDYNNPDYAGYKWRGITGFTEQAYISYQTNRLQVKFGRDFIKWGPGQSGTLVMSDIARPLDHLFAAVNFGPFRFSYFASELDRAPGKKAGNAWIPVRRYLAGHRLDVRFWGGRIQAGISELMLYGGEAEKFNIVYVNPVIFYHGANYNNSDISGNVLPSVDFMVYPQKNWQIYTSLLIDDIQIEKTVQDDMEPDEIGFILGTNYSDPLQIQGMNVNLEYVRVANRTYKTPDPLETFIHRGQPLGHPLGNDFDTMLLGISQWIRPTMWAKVDFKHIRHGEGSIYSPWDTPWRAFTLEEGYDEPFPTGIVETENRFDFYFRWYYKSYLRLNLISTYIDVKNIHNVEGENDSFFEGKFNIELDLFRKWKLHE